VAGGSGFRTRAAGLLVELDAGKSPPTGIYFTPNPLRPEEIKSPLNGPLKPARKGGCAHAEMVLVRHWLLVDVDPVKPDGAGAALAAGRVLPLVCILARTARRSHQAAGTASCGFSTSGVPSTEDGAGNVRREVNLLP
jgi:hypothetical protein